MSTIKIPKQQLEDMNLPDRALVDAIVGLSRWHITREIIFSYNDKYYSAKYNVGATELQECSPWEYDDEVECTEVHQVEKLVKVWEPI